MFIWDKEQGQKLKSIPFEVEENLKETTLHGEGDFPVAVYLQRYNLSPTGNVILHWHEEVQFVIQHTGRSLYTVSDETFHLNTGDVLFINSGRLHMASPVEQPGSSYICIDIHPSFIYGMGNELFNRKYVMPFINSGLSAIHLDGSEEWHSEVKALLTCFMDVFDRQEFAYEMEIHRITTQIWLILIRNNAGRMKSEHVMTHTEQLRLEKLQKFIQENYTEELSLADIAAAGDISKSECCRFFSRTVGASPITYLNNYRLVKSTKLLISTNKSVTEIAQLSGFSTASYYSGKFKKLMNCTPLEYRRRFSLTSGPSLNRILP